TEAFPIRIWILSGDMIAHSHSHGIKQVLIFYGFDFLSEICGVWIGSTLEFAKKVPFVYFVLKLCSLQFYLVLSDQFRMNLIRSSSFGDYRLEVFNSIPIPEAKITCIETQCSDLVSDFLLVLSACL